LPERRVGDPDDRMRQKNERQRNAQKNERRRQREKRKLF
jgi:hypothetical protein